MKNDIHSNNGGVPQVKINNIFFSSCLIFQIDIIKYIGYIRNDFDSIS